MNYTFNSSSVSRDKIKSQLKHPCTDVHQIFTQHITTYIRPNFFTSPSFIMDRFQDLEDRINDSKTDLNEMNEDLVSQLNDLRNETNELEGKIKQREFYKRYSPYMFECLENLKTKSGLGVIEWMLVEKELAKLDNAENDTEARRSLKRFFRELCEGEGLSFDMALSMLRFVWTQGPQF